MRVFREVVPQKKKETQPAVRYQEARIGKKSRTDGADASTNIAAALYAGRISKSI